MECWAHLHSIVCGDYGEEGFFKTEIRPKVSIMQSM